MKDAINRFYNSIERASDQSQSNLIEFFVYFLTVELGKDYTTPQQISDCFKACDLIAPKGLNARLSEGLRCKPQKFIRTSEGYKLQRHMREMIASKFGANQTSTQTSVTLRGLEHKMPPGQGLSFLRETIDCFEAGANRATIVMTWILTMDHLYGYILTHHLDDLNAVLAAKNDRGVKVKVITQRDDLADIKESKFIEFCRTAKIISHDVKKILTQKLDIRNSCAHPSDVSINRTKVIDFVEDLVENVVLKYVV